MKPLSVLIVVVGIVILLFFVFNQPPGVMIREQKNSLLPVAVLKTNYGDIQVELLATTTPVTVQNFITLAQGGFYNNLTFHRVIDGFMIQGGDPNGNGTGGPGYTIPDELPPGNRNNQGTIAMANRGPNTGGSQFFINLADNNYLDSRHPVFGRVIKGFAVVLAIGKVPTDKTDRPLKPVIIESVTIVNPP